MKTKALPLIAIAAVLFTACSKDNPEIPDRQVKFSSGINAPQTKVGGVDGNEWNINDPVGIFMRDAGGAIVDNNLNIKYTSANQGTSTVFRSDRPMYYPENGTRVNFLAYHPYNLNVDIDYLYPVDLSKQTSQTNIDLMVATANNSGNGYDKSNDQNVNLVFDHQLVKIVINVVIGPGVDTSVDGMTAVIKGMNNRAEFNILNREFSNAGTEENITPLHLPDSPGIYEAILLPATLEDRHIVEFTATNGNVYTWVMKNNNTNQPISMLEKGNKYTFNITVERKQLNVSGTINPWQSVGGVITGVAY